MANKTLVSMCVTVKRAGAARPTHTRLLTVLGYVIGALTAIGAAYSQDAAVKPGRRGPAGAGWTQVVSDAMTIDFSAAAAHPAEFRATGFLDTPDLHSIQQYANDLRPQVVRVSGKGELLQNLEAIQAAGARAEVIVSCDIPHEFYNSWCACNRGTAGTCPGDSPGNNPYADWDRVVDNLLAVASDDVVYDVYNEPDLQDFFNPASCLPDATPACREAAYFEVWDYTYRKIRKARPNAIIAGPSDSSCFDPEYTHDFLIHVSQADTAPDIFTSHCNGSPEVILARMAPAKDWIDASGLWSETQAPGRISGVEVNEYVGQGWVNNGSTYGCAGPSGQDGITIINTGINVHFIAALERGFDLFSGGSFFGAVHSGWTEVYSPESQGGWPGMQDDPIYIAINAGCACLSDGSYNDDLMNTSLNGLLTNDSSPANRQPRSAYYAYAGYALVTGQRASVTGTEVCSPGDSTPCPGTQVYNVDAVAASDATLPGGVGATILLGARPDADVEETITLTNLTGSTMFPLIGNVDIWVSTVTPTGNAASDGWQGPATPSWSDLPVSSGTLTFGPLQVPADSVVLLQITQSGSQQPGREAARRVSTEPHAPSVCRYCRSGSRR